MTGRLVAGSVARGASGTTGPFARMSVRNFLAIAASHEASMLAVSLLRAAVPGQLYKSAQSCVASESISANANGGGRFLMGISAS